MTQFASDGYDFCGLLTLIENINQISLFQRFHPMVKYENQKKLKRITIIDNNSNRNVRKQKRKNRRLLFVLESTVVPKPYYTKMLF